MNLSKRLAGKIIYGISRLIDILLDGLITIIEFIVSLIGDIAGMFVTLIGMGGCLLLFLFMSPFGWLILFNPIVSVSIITAIFIFVIVPFLGTKFVSYLKYRRYMITEFLYDYADYLTTGDKEGFTSFSEYGDKYRRMEEEKRREEWRKRQEQQQREWEERFRQWYEYQESQRRHTGYGGTWGNGQGPNYGNQTYANPITEFKGKYEKSCDILEVPYTSDKYEIKLAYRKKAKQYHPDINKSPDATKKFQEINDAYEFLSDENIQRYKSVN